MLLDESWRPIEGYNGKYEVSCYGEVRGYKESIHAGHVLWEQFTVPEQINIKNKSASVKLHKDGIEKSVYVHRLVAQAFIPNPLAKAEVNHKDGNRLNNESINLEWVTRKENMDHAFDNDLIDAHKVILVDKQDGKKYYFRSKREASGFLGKYNNYISDKIKNKKTEIDGYFILTPK
ncbi:NUMOD4 motif-containing HNH endonuclease [Gracilibacillus oryzae]|nr:NUMOD4 motif-containing HNH endonuclease [Gracilibacillus oryzae]